MALWTMLVETGEFRYFTQISAPDARGAMRKLLQGNSAKKVLGREYPEKWPYAYSMKDVSQLLPAGKSGRNMYFCSLIKKGIDDSIVVVILVRTVSRQYAQ